jgi:predicted  nucleic acid-binding Zn-ribbon protein
MKPLCVACGDVFSAARRAVGYQLCLPCGEQQARRVKHTVAPLHKSNYVLISNHDDLVGLNNKGGLVR